MTATDITRDGSGVLQWAGRTLSPRDPLQQMGQAETDEGRRKARDRDSAGKLWKLSAQLTGCDWQEN